MDRNRWKKGSAKVAGSPFGLTAKPGNNVFVANRGEVRFEIPQGWLIKPGKEGSVQFHDAEPPADNCTLEMSTAVLRDDLGIGTSKLPLSELVKKMATRDKRSPFFWGEPERILTPKLNAAWLEVRFIDPNEKREAHSRTCVAFRGLIQCLITFDYWATYVARMRTVWNDVLGSLVLGEYLDRPCTPRDTSAN